VTKGTAPTLSPIVDSTTNQVRMSGDLGYDANGNWLGMPSARNTWNVENQLLSTGTVDGDGNPITYTYDPWGRRVLQFSASNYGPSGTLYFYSITGQRLAMYSAGYPTQTSQLSASMYFGARPLKAVDRLGSVRAKFGSNGVAQIAYYPWGEERTSTADGTDKFATYFRDGVGQDYANARYFNSNLGRFWSPDPSVIGNPTDPVSFNRYAYTGGDPVNRTDSTGAGWQCTPGPNGEPDSCWYQPDPPWMYGANLVAVGCSASVLQSAAYGYSGNLGQQMQACNQAVASMAGMMSRGGSSSRPASTGPTAWQYLNSIWSNCLSDFKKDSRFDASAFSGLLNNGITWLDARDPSVAARTIDSYTHNGNTETLAEAFAGGASAITLEGSNYVAVGVNYFTDETQTQQIAIAIHEALHIVTYGWGGDFVTNPDGALMGWLENFGFKPTSGYSGDMTDWIVGTADHMSTSGGGCKNP